MKAETVLKRIEEIAVILKKPILTKEIEAIYQDIRLEKIKAGKIVEITVLTGEGKKQVDAIPYGEIFAINETAGHKRGFTVTHIPTGISVVKSYYKNTAIKLARYLSQLDVDCNTKVIGTLREILDPFKPELKRIASE